LGILWAPIKGDATGWPNPVTPYPTHAGWTRGYSLPKRHHHGFSRGRGDYLYCSVLSEATVSSAGLGLNPPT